VHGGLTGCGSVVNSVVSLGPLVLVDAETRGDGDAGDRVGDVMLVFPAGESVFLSSEGVELLCVSTSFVPV